MAETSIDKIQSSLVGAAGVIALIVLERMEAPTWLLITTAIGFLAVALGLKWFLSTVRKRIALGISSLAYLIVASIAMWPKADILEDCPEESRLASLGAESEKQIGPIIRLDFQVFGDTLPLCLAPRAKIKVVVIDKVGEPTIGEYTNISYTKASLWPSNLTATSPVATITLANIGDANAFGVTVPLLFGDKKAKIELLSIDLRSEGRDSQVFYIVNKSSSLSAIWFQPFATALVQSEQRHRLVPITLAGFEKITYTDSTTGERAAMSAIPPTANWHE